MQNQVQQHSYRSRAVPRQLPELVEPELMPSLAVPMLGRSGSVQSRAGQGLCLLMLNSYRLWPMLRQLPVLVEPEVLPSLFAPVLDRFGPVQAVPPLAGQRLRRQPLPWRVRAAGALRRLMKIQVYRHLYRSQAGPRQLPVLVEPVVPPSLAVLAMLHFAPVQAVPPLAGQRLPRQPLPGWVMAARTLHRLMKNQVQQHSYRPWAGPPLLPV